METRTADRTHHEPAALHLDPLFDEVVLVE